MKSVLKKEKNNKGFTLVELVIVIAILAILVGLLAPQYTKYVEKSRKAADIGGTTDVTLVEGDLTELKKEMENSIPSYTSTKTKSKKWGKEGAKADISATVIVNTQGGTSVTYEPEAFNNYMKTGTEEKAPTN